MGAKRLIRNSIGEALVRASSGSDFSRGVASAFAEAGDPVGNVKRKVVQVVSPLIDTAIDNIKYRHMNRRLPDVPQTSPDGADGPEY
ncbi:MAG: hypothetical protein U0L73_12170 [Ruminococcus bromii]|nr:hypothetical protein [Ruminococcus bromii]